MLTELNKNYQNKFPFVVFSNPHNSKVTGYFQKDGKNYASDEFENDKVVLAPFNFENALFCIPKVESELIEYEIEKKSISEVKIPLAENKEDQQQHLDIIRLSKKVIGSRKANKIVVSRRKDVPITNLDLSVIFIRLFNLYPNAYRYIWYHPETGVWCGASPEILLKTENTSFETMALAGTQVYNPKRAAIWTDKEREEQQIVTDAITSNLQKVTSVVKISKTYDHKAGALVHLRTDISGILKRNKATVNSVAKALHPTPAVCGTPQKEAKKFILENEGYNREFYTGFIGKINTKNQESELYVNLRCMKLEEGIASLYVGGGITNQSVAEDEWLETHNKLQTMLQVLEPLL